MNSKAAVHSLVDLVGEVLRAGNANTRSLKAAIQKASPGWVKDATAAVARYREWLARPKAWLVQAEWLAGGEMLTGQESTARNMMEAGARCTALYDAPPEGGRSRLPSAFDRTLQTAWLPDARFHNPDPEYLRQLADSTGLTYGRIAEITGVSPRTLRNYLSDSGAKERPAPYLVQYALECMAPPAIRAPRGAV